MKIGAARLEPPLGAHERRQCGPIHTRRALVAHAPTRPTDRAAVVGDIGGQQQKAQRKPADQPYPDQALPARQRRPAASRSRCADRPARVRPARSANASSVTVAIAMHSDRQPAKGDAGGAQQASTASTARRCSKRTRAKRRRTAGIASRLRPAQGEKQRKAQQPRQHQSGSKRDVFHFNESRTRRRRLRRTEPRRSAAGRRPSAASFAPDRTAPLCA